MPSCSAIQPLPAIPPTLSTVAIATLQSAVFGLSAPIQRRDPQLARNDCRWRWPRRPRRRNRRSSPRQIGRGGAGALGGPQAGAAGVRFLGTPAWLHTKVGARLRANDRSPTTEIARKRAPTFYGANQGRISVRPIEYR